MKRRAAESLYLVSRIDPSMTIVGAVHATSPAEATGKFKSPHRYTARRVSAPIEADPERPPVVRPFRELH